MNVFLYITLSFTLLSIDDIVSFKLLFSATEFFFLYHIFSRITNIKDRESE